jgi:hypothetical protein
MKKIMIFTFAMLMMVAFAMPAMALEGTGVMTLGTGTTGNALSYGLSSNVTLDYVNGASYTMYGIGTTHKAGNREYQTSNETTLIYYNTKGTGTTTVTTPSAGFTTPSSGFSAL